MVTIFEGSVNNNCVRYEHHSLVMFYLDQAQSYADVALKAHSDGTLQSDSIVAIIFSAMCVEAFVNETAEGLFRKEDLDDFSFLRGQFKKRGKSSSLVKKLALIFWQAFQIDAPRSLLDSVEELVKLRNNLVHYKLTDTATKFVYPPLVQRESSGGEMMTVVEFVQEPKAVIAPFVQAVTGSAAKRSLDAAISVLDFWNENINDREEG
ncbi:hypothetical protein NO559_11585 [Dasania sp. GY-MA-18]|uniref:RiboL-PSP-HEPN domain-containing protein n=1 Tax=Dasania phycosphaerae TaxID=2950436 RepID=A0A9J6RMY9_9GAMM|nr:MULTISPECIES: hypothetical protein [Dasania]MCR8923419.1 hypothetical protein [Dasania sp. GY-MA-18]MCZ0865852.1 hypothetical protein [Dasania phycosphaerae]MCZ0869576.1 hypothetical protein [Dasania phycosphaerae]